MSSLADALRCEHCGETLTLRPVAVAGVGVVTLCRGCEERYNAEVDSVGRVFVGQKTICEGASLILKGLSELYGVDLQSPDLLQTPSRVSRMFVELCRGYNEDPLAHLKSALVSADHQDLVVVDTITFTSLCAHHLAVITGTVEIGYLPGAFWVGLSKFGRMVDSFAKRLQIQERMTAAIADCIGCVLQPRGVMVIVRAKHDCMCKRGATKQDSTTTVSAVRGVFLVNESGIKDEYLAILKAQGRFYD
jgi:GTP cyclohydrolase I